MTWFPYVKIKFGPNEDGIISRGKKSKLNYNLARQRVKRYLTMIYQFILLTFFLIAGMDEDTFLTPKMQQSDLSIQARLLKLVQCSYQCFDQLNSRFLRSHNNMRNIRSTFMEHIHRNILERMGGGEIRLKNVSRRICATN